MDGNNETKVLAEPVEAVVQTQVGNIDLKWHLYLFRVFIDTGYPQKDETLVMYEIYFVI